MLYNSHPVSDLFKKEFLEDYEDDPRFGTFYTYIQWISQYKKKKKKNENKEKDNINIIPIKYL